MPRLHVIALCALCLGASCARDARFTDETGETSRPLMQNAAGVARVQERPWLGQVLFTETFDDAALERRGWYDTGTARTRGAFECRFAAGATTCADGIPGRRLFDGVDEVYVGYRVRYDPGWVGSGRPYHPHELHLLTTLEDRYAGPSYTYLTLYIENVGLHGQVAIQDGRNVDARCILRNDDAVSGCDGGPLSAFPFGENRSVAACNGLVGPVQLRDCYELGPGQWYSARAWRTEAAVLASPPGQDGWHFVEAYVRLNSIRDGVGVPDGAIRYAIDGVETLTLDSLLLRTGRHPDMRFNQLLIAPYMGDGSPIDQTMWIDDLTVAHGRRN